MAVNGERMDLVGLISLLNKVVGAHGFGRVDHVENRVVGFKSREVYEAPAALTLIEAHRIWRSSSIRRLSIGSRSLLIRNGLTWFMVVYGMSHCVRSLAISLSP